MLFHSEAIIMKRPEQLLVDFMKQHNLTVAFAESMTCGMASMKIGNVTGTSEIFAGSIVCYDEQVKIKLLQVSPRLLKKHTAESREATDALAANLGKLIPADFHCGITGLAAPGGSETVKKPIGTVFISVMYKDKLFRIRKKFNGSPLVIKQKACTQLFRFLLLTMKKQIQHYRQES